MSFVTPLALAWAALTIPIVIFYILKIRLRQVPVSTTIFWQQIYDEKSPRSLWQQLRHWLSLLVQIVWLLLLVLALAEPFLLSANWQPRRTVLVIDNSASMNATDVSPTRLAAAKRAAANTVASLRFGDEMAIIAAGTQPKVICGLTNHERTLQTAIERVAKSDGPGRVAEAVELAKRLTSDVKNAQVIVYSDGGFTGANQLASDPVVKVQPVGSLAVNVGITQFQVRRSLADPIGYEILVEVFNASAEPAECRLDLDLDENPVDVVPLKLSAGQVWSQTFEKTSIEGGRLVATLHYDDPLSTDNQAVALLPKRELTRVLLISPGNLFLQKALEANPLVELATAKQLPAKYEAGIVHVFHRMVPETLPEGPSLFVDPRADCDGWIASEVLDNPIVTKQDTNSPLMQHVRLDNVLLPKARRIKPAEGAQVLVSAVSGDPLYFTLERPGKKALVLTVDLDEGDLTLRTAFPIMVANALGWFSGQSGELREAIVAGAVTEVDLSQASQPGRFSVWSPSGVQRPLPAGITKPSIGPLDEIGVWSVRESLDKEATAEKAPGGSLTLEFACNLANKAESDLRLPESWQGNAAETAAAGSIFVRPIWFYLLGLAWILAIAEWFLYQRRWIG
jgi:hypothetical protein